MLSIEDLKHLPQLPGVYRMLDAQQQLLYVGKAKALKRRVSSYFQKEVSSLKTQILVEKIAAIEITVTTTEAEALILEQILIKRHKPPYNILLKDDKSYPYIYLSSEQAFPRICFYRGPLNKPGKFYGPFVTGSALRDTLALLQKVFKVRQCEDAFFRNRTRPCLQYQIQRCTGPCVGLVTKEDYQQQVKHTQTFLEGRSVELIAQLVAQMEQAAVAHQYEKAAEYRDQITGLQQIQAQQHISGSGQGDVDVIAVALGGASACVNILHIRQGQMVGQHHQFISLHTEEDARAVLAAFVPQYYLSAAAQTVLPKEIVLSEELEESTALAEAILTAKDLALADKDFLAKQHGLADGQLLADKDLLNELAAVPAIPRAGRLRITASVRGERAAWVKLSQLNADQQLQLRLAARATQQQCMQQLQEDLGLAITPGWLECFDISHTQGEKTVAACVVFDHQGAVKSRYRRFNIEDITPGDDYAAIHQAVFRRYRPQEDAANAPERILPDVIVIDGGKGQLQSAYAALEAVGLGQITLISIAKGPMRKSGLETLFGYTPQTAKINELTLRPQAFLLLQQIRDEAHRFAITGHRNRRDKARRQSSLETIPGVGAKRRKILLNHFGGLQGLRQASVADIARLPGISASLATEIVAAIQIK